MSGQRGGAISLLLALVVIGALAYLALSGSAKAPNAPGAPLDCERRINLLIQRTGGLGEAYGTGYAALPPACQKLTPAPGALEPSPTRSPES